MITKPEIQVEFRYQPDKSMSYTAHVGITMEAISDDRDKIRDEVMDTLRGLIRGHHDVKMIVITEEGTTA